MYLLISVRLNWSIYFLSRSLVLFSKSLSVRCFVNCTYIPRMCLLFCPACTKYNVKNVFILKKLTLRVFWAERVSSKTSHALVGMSEQPYSLLRLLKTSTFLRVTGWLNWYSVGLKILWYQWPEFEPRHIRSTQKNCESFSQSKRLCSLAVGVLNPRVHNNNHIRSLKIL